MMTQDTAVRIETSVAAPIDRAFAVFVEQIGSWWPRTHQIGSGELADVVIEPKQGGRWYERAADGTECDWGEVLAWDPPHQVALSWAITPAWQSAPSDQASRIDVRFTSSGPDSTEVVLVHSELDRHGDSWESMRDAVAGPNGWTSILAGYAKTAA
jgi:uncharacterized protein YndB with AHSA1/START domain